MQQLTRFPLDPRNLISRNLFAWAQLEQNVTFVVPRTKLHVDLGIWFPFELLHLSLGSCFSVQTLSLLSPAYRNPSAAWEWRLLRLRILFLWAVRPLPTLLNYSPLRGISAWTSVCFFISYCSFYWMWLHFWKSKCLSLKKEMKPTISRCHPLPSISLVCFMVL